MNWRIQREIVEDFVDESFNTLVDEDFFDKRQYGVEEDNSDFDEAPNVRFCALDAAKLQIVDQGRKHRCKHLEIWPIIAFDAQRRFRKHDTSFSIEDLSEAVDFKPLVNMFAEFMLHVAKK